jgi:hypothetical protein
MLSVVLVMGFVIICNIMFVEDVSLSSSESIYRSLYFTPSTNVPPISFNIVGNALIVSSVPWSLSMSFEFKQWGVVICVFESAWYCRDAFEDRRALMRCPKPKLHQCMISESEYFSCLCILSNSTSLSSSLQSSSLQ